MLVGIQGVDELRHHRVGNDDLNTNLDLYRNRFGDPPAPPVQNPNQGRRPSPQEIYDDLKLPDDVLSGVYANGVMIGHGASEFGLDFLTSFFPQSAVSARVFVAAGQVPRLLDSLRGAVRQLDQRKQGAASAADGATDVANPPVASGTDGAGEPDLPPHPPSPGVEPPRPDIEPPGVEPPSHPHQDPPSDSDGNPPQSGGPPGPLS